MRSLLRRDGALGHVTQLEITPRPKKIRTLTTSLTSGAAIVLAACIGLHAAPSAAQADDADLEEASEEVAREDKSETGTGLTLQERIKAVSRPVFIKKGRFEISPFHGFSANDAFFERLQIGARASYHIFDWLSAEGGGAFNYFSVPLQSVRVIGSQQLIFDDPAPLLGYADVGVNFSPLYAKAALVSEWVVHFDAFATAGVGAVFDLEPGDIPVAPAVALGVGARAFISEWFVVRLDLKNFSYVNKLTTTPSLENGFFINLGVGFYFPFEGEDDETVVKVSG